MSWRHTVRTRCSKPRWLRCYVEWCGKCGDYEPLENTNQRRLGSYGWLPAVVELLDEGQDFRLPHELPAESIDEQGKPLLRPPRRPSVAAK